jgi:hypothetical protein
MIRTTTEYGGGDTFGRYHVGVDAIPQYKAKRTAIRMLVHYDRLILLLKSQTSRPFPHTVHAKFTVTQISLIQRSPTKNISAKKSSIRRFRESLICKDACTRFYSRVSPTHRATPRAHFRNRHRLIWASRATFHHIHTTAYSHCKFSILPHRHGHANLKSSMSGHNSALERARTLQTSDYSRPNYARKSAQWKCLQKDWLVIGEQPNLAGQWTIEPVGSDTIRCVHRSADWQRSVA